MNMGLGVVAVTYGAGALNTVNAIACAYAERSPVVVLAGCPGAVEAHSGLALHHQVRHVDSQLRVFAEITCDQVRLDDPATAPALIARALRSCREFSQPVLVEIPRDLAEREMGAVPMLPPSPFVQAAVDECAREWLARIQAAERPVLMPGVEVRRFGIEAEVAELARRLALPVLTTFMGRGLLADAGLPCHATYLGVAGAPAISDQQDKSDQPVKLGLIQSDSNFGIAGERIEVNTPDVQSLDTEEELVIHGGDGNDLLQGGAGSDTLDGNDGDDSLSGLFPEGDDTAVDFLNGGDGDDTLTLGAGDLGTGGAGADDFILSQWLGEGGFATIADYQAGEYQIEVV